MFPIIIDYNSNVWLVNRSSYCAVYMRYEKGNYTSFPLKLKLDLNCLFVCLFVRLFVYSPSNHKNVQSKIYIAIWIAKYMKTDRMDGLAMSESLRAWFCSSMHGVHKQNYNTTRWIIRPNTQIQSNIINWLNELSRPRFCLCRLIYLE